ncbi:MAG: adenosine kinase [Halofilum sp. (in: g-proteobacteria)]
MSQYDVYGLGNALVDMEYQVTPEELQEMGIDKGVMTLMDVDQQSELMVWLSDHHVHRSAGGSAANSVIALSQLGGRGYYTCKVADDELGHLYTKDLKENGVDTNAHDGREEGHTGRCMVFVTPDADRTMATFLGITGGLGENELNPTALRDSKYLYMEGYLATSDTAREAAVRARGIAEEAGVKTSLSLSDPNIVTHFKDQLLDIIGPGLDLVFANEDEAQGITGTGSLDDAVAYMKSIGKEFVITRGPNPSLVWDGKELIEIPAQNLTPLDTVGAGDMFAGSFLYGITQGWSHRAAGELAAATAAKLIVTYGPRLPAAETRGVLAKVAQRAPEAAK